MDPSQKNSEDDTSVNSDISPIVAENILPTSPTTLSATANFQFSPILSQTPTANPRNIGSGIPTQTSSNRELGDLCTNINLNSITSPIINSTGGRRMSLDRDTNSTTPDASSKIQNSTNMRRISLDRDTSSITPDIPIPSTISPRIDNSIDDPGANQRPSMDKYGDEVIAAKAGTQDSKAATADFITTNLISEPERRREDIRSRSGVVLLKGTREDPNAAEDEMSDDDENDLDEDELKEEEVLKATQSKNDKLAQLIAQNQLEDDDIVAQANRTKEENEDMQAELDRLEKEEEEEELRLAELKRVEDERIRKEAEERERQRIADELQEKLRLIEVQRAKEREEAELIEKLRKEQEERERLKAQQQAQELEALRLQVLLIQRELEASRQREEAERIEKERLKKELEEQQELERLRVQRRFELKRKREEARAGAFLQAEEDIKASEELLRQQEQSRRERQSLADAEALKKSQLEARLEELKKKKANRALGISNPPSNAQSVAQATPSLATGASRSVVDPLAPVVPSRLVGPFDSRQSLTTGVSPIPAGLASSETTKRSSVSSPQEEEKERKRKPLMKSPAQIAEEEDRVKQQTLQDDQRCRRDLANQQEMKRLQNLEEEARRRQREEDLKREQYRKDRVKAQLKRLTEAEALLEASISSNKPVHDISAATEMRRDALAILSEICDDHEHAALQTQQAEREVRRLKLIEEKQRLDREKEQRTKDEELKLKEEEVRLRRVAKLLKRVTQTEITLDTPTSSVYHISEAKGLRNASLTELEEICNPAEAKALRAQQAERTKRIEQEKKDAERIAKLQAVSEKERMAKEQERASKAAKREREANKKKVEEAEEEKKATLERNKRTLQERQQMRQSAKESSNKTGLLTDMESESGARTTEADELKYQVIIHDGELDMLNLSPEEDVLSDLSTDSAPLVYGSNGQPIEHRTVFELLEESTNVRRPKNDVKSINAEESNRREHLIDGLADRGKAHWNRIKVINTPNLDEDEKEILQEATDGWSWTKRWLISFFTKLSDREFKEVLARLEYWRQRMRLALFKVEELQKAKRESLALPKPSFTESSEYPLLVEAKAKAVKKALATSKSRAANDGGDGNEDGSDSSEESSSSSSETESSSSSSEDGGQKGNEGEKVASNPARKEKSEKSEKSKLRDEVATSEIKTTVKSGPQSSKPLSIPAAPSSTKPADSKPGTLKAVAKSAGKATKTKKEEVAKIPVASLSQQPSLALSQNYFTESEMLLNARVYFEQSAEATAAAASTVMVRISGTPLEDASLQFRNRFKLIDASLDETRHYLLSQYDREPTVYDNLGAVKRTILDSIYVIRTILIWCDRQSAQFNEKLPCIVAKLEDEPRTPRSIRDPRFPSVENYSERISPLLNAHLIMSIPELMRVSSEYTTPSWTGLPTGNSIGRRIGFISDGTSIADQEMQRGNTILCSHLGLIDHRYRYVHGLKALWFESYEKEESRDSKTEKARIEATIIEEYEGEGLPDDDSDSARMRLGLRTSPFALFGQVGFRYQDPLPLVQVQVLQTTFAELSDRACQSPQANEHYEELRELFQSTYFKQLLLLGPNAETKNTFVRPKLLQHITVMRALFHCHQWIEDLKFVVSNINHQIEPTFDIELEQLEREIVKRDKVQAKHVLAYRLTEVKTFQDLGQAIDKARAEQLFVPVMKTKSLLVRYHERARTRLIANAEVEYTASLFSQHATESPNARFQIVSRPPRAKSPPKPKSTRTTKVSKIASVPTAESKAQESLKYTTFIYARHQSSKSKVEMILVSPDALFKLHGDTYDQVRRRENFMYGYSKSELEVLEEAEEQYDLDPHASEVLASLQARRSEMVVLDEEDLRFHKYRRNRLGAMESYQTVDITLKVNKEFEALLKELLDERSNAQRQLAKVKEEDERRQKGALSSSPSDDRKELSDPDDPRVPSTDRRRSQMPNVERVEPRSADVKLIGDESSESDLPYTPSVVQDPTLHNDMTLLPAKSYKRKALVPSNVKAEAEPIDLRPFDDDNDENDEDGSVVVIAGPKTSNSKPTKEFIQQREDLVAQKILLEVGKATLAKDRELQSLQLQLEQQRMENERVNKEAELKDQMRVIATQNDQLTRDREKKDIEFAREIEKAKEESRREFEESQKAHLLELEKIRNASREREKMLSTTRSAPLTSRKANSQPMGQTVLRLTGAGGSLDGSKSSVGAQVESLDHSGDEGRALSSVSSVGDESVTEILQIPSNLAEQAPSRTPNASPKSGQNVITPPSIRGSKETRRSKDEESDSDSPALSTYSTASKSAMIQRTRRSGNTDTSLSMAKIIGDAMISSSQANIQAMTASSQANLDAIAVSSEANRRVLEAIAAANQSSSQMFSEGLLAIQKTMVMAKEVSPTSIVVSKRKGADSTLMMNVQPDEIWLGGLNSLPNNHSRSGTTTDLSTLPVYDGSQVFVSLMNEVFDFCVSRMLNHTSLLSLIQGLQIFSPGIKIKVRLWMTDLDASLFRQEDDSEDDKGQSPAVTRMLIHCVRKLCKDFYVKPKQNALQMINTMDAFDFASVDEKNRPSFLHFDNIIPFVTSILTSAEPWHRTEANIKSAVEGIIDRSGDLRIRYSFINDQYRPEWEKLTPLARCAIILEQLSSQDKEKYTWELQKPFPTYSPPMFSSTINGYMRSAAPVIEETRKPKKDKDRDRGDKRGETIKSNVAFIDPSNYVELFDITVNDTYYADDAPTQQELEKYQEFIVSNSAQLTLAPDHGRELSEVICEYCGCEDHAEKDCYMRLKWLPTNYSAKAPHAKNPLSVWKYAGLRNIIQRDNMINTAARRGYFSHSADNHTHLTKFREQVTAAVIEETRKYDQRKLDWQERNPGVHKAQEEERLAKERKYAAQYQKDAKYGVSGRGGQRTF